VGKTFSRRKKAMIINHNIAALNTIRQLSVNATNTQKALEKLSSGLRINSAADDAAGLAISEKMRGQIRGLDMAQKNAQDGISLIQTAEGALNETHSILQRMRELAVQSANDTNTDEDRAQLQKEMNQLAKEVTRISNDTEFNTQKLLNGNFKGTFQIGANEGQNISLSISNMSANSLGIDNTSAIINIDGGTTNYTSGSDAGLDNLKTGDYTVKVAADGTVELYVGSTKIGSGSVVDSGATVGITVTDTSYLINSSNTTITLGISDTDSTSGVATTAGTISISVTAANDGGIDITTQQGADSAITAIDNAIETVSTQRSALGAYQNRLEHTINNLGTSSQNLTAAESRIRDVDYALAA
jgi:flagellin